MRLPIALVTTLLIAACSAPAPTGGPLQSPTSGELPVLVVVDDFFAEAPTLTVAEALTHGSTDDLVRVTGSLFVDPDGTVRLCDAYLESFPPQCGGDRIEVEGLDLDTMERLQTEGDVSWAEGVTLLGAVE